MRGGFGPASEPVRGKCTAYSSLRWALQKSSVRPITASSASVLSSFNCSLGTRFGFGSFAKTGMSEIGSDVTIPCRALASLNPSFNSRRMPGPNEMLYPEMMPS